MISYLQFFSPRRRIGLLDQLEFTSLKTMVLLEDIVQEATVYIGSSGLVVHGSAVARAKFGVR